MQKKKKKIREKTKEVRLGEREKKDENPSEKGKKHGAALVIGSDHDARAKEEEKKRRERSKRKRKKW